MVINFYKEDSIINLMEGQDGLEGKKIYVILKTGRFYSGVVKSIDDNFITMIDKYGEIVMFSKSEISSLEEESDKNERKV